MNRPSFVHILLLSFVVGTLISPALWAGELSPQLSARLAQTHSSTFLDVVIVMKEKAQVGPGSEECEIKIQQMKKFCAESQSGVIEYLEKQKFFGRVENYNTFWLMNSIAVRTMPMVIRYVAALPEVETVLIPGHFEIPVISESTGVRSLQTVSIRPLQASPYEDNLTFIKVPDVWSILADTVPIRGKNVVVGIIDTGIDATHLDLQGKVLNRATSNSQGAITVGVAAETTGHGTHVASIVVGGNAGGTSIGVAPDAKIMMVHAFDFNADEGKLTASDPQILGSIQWLMEQEVDLINMSFGGEANEANSTFYSGSGGFRGIASVISQFGGVMVAAIGNGGPSELSTNSPGNIPQVIGVGGTLKASTEVASYSSRGPIDWKGTDGYGVIIKPDIMAPGGIGVISPIPIIDVRDILGARSGGGYRTLGGTSQAAPHLTGVIALMMQADTTLTLKGSGTGLDRPKRFDRIKNALYATVTDLRDVGKDNVTGFGLVNALLAVRAVLGPDTVSPSIEVLSASTPIFGQPFTLRVKVVDNRVFNPTVKLFYRRDSRSSNDFQEMFMTQVDTFIYQAVIPQSDAVENFSYYVEANDGINPSSFSPAQGRSSASVVTLQASSVASSADILSGPSPFNPNTSTFSFTFRHSQNADIQIQIYDVTGNTIQVIPVSGVFGYNVVSWDGSTGFGGSIRDGAYIYQIIAGGKLIPGGRGKFLVIRP